MNRQTCPAHRRLPSFQTDGIRVSGLRPVGVFRVGHEYAHH